MRDLALNVISQAAAASGLTVPEVPVSGTSTETTPAAVPVVSAAKKDNITLPVPRIEVALGGVAYERSGKRLGFVLVSEKRRIKREIYRIIQKVIVTLFSDDEAFLANAVPALVKALPRGVNDDLGNWVKISVKSGSPAGYEVTKIGDTAIDPLPKRRETLELEFSGRLTTLEPVNFINNFNLTSRTGEEND